MNLTVYMGCVSSVVCEFFFDTESGEGGCVQCKTIQHGQGSVKICKFALKYKNI
jgi:hypothetical protein